VLETGEQEVQADDEGEQMMADRRQKTDREQQVSISGESNG